MRFFRSLKLALVPLPIWAITTACTARGENPPPIVSHAAKPAVSLFDPARHMHVSEVTPGMTGYGLTVFHGSKIERFDVEVISVLHNFNPKNDVVLIRCKGDFLEHTGSIAGMSGSPVFLTDAAGHDRMIGAFAYGWPLTKDPLAGVQPIEYMLQLPIAGTGGGDAPVSAVSPAAAAKDSSPDSHPAGRVAWSMIDAGMLPVPWAHGVAKASRQSDPGRKETELLGNGAMARLEPLATPLMMAGMPPGLFEKLEPRFRAAGLTALQAGSGGSAAAARSDIQLAPGSVLAVPLLTGDLEMTAIGTTTEVIGNKIWGFGHPFNNEGPISLPMGSGVINGIVANLNTSFKLGSMTSDRGTLMTDASVGVAGETGPTPTTVPIDIVVQPADGAAQRTYHFNASRHPKFTPLIVSAAFAAALAGSSELPPLNTVDYQLELTFSNGQTVSLSDRAVNGTAADLFGDAAVVMQAASDNPFQRVLVRKITGSATVKATSAAAQIIDVNLPRSKYHPGDKVKAFVAYQPFHGAEAILPIDIDLPRELPPGPYQLIVSDAQRYFQDEQQSRPFRFMAENIGDVFAVLKDVATIRENAIYIRLLQRPDGVAVGHTALSRLPSSRREILLASGRSNTTPFISSTVRMMPTDLVMAGSSEFTIIVEAATKSVLGAPRGAKVEPTAVPAPKAEEPHKAPPSADAPGKKDSPKENTPVE